jgi:hypothetical protein
VYAVLAEPVVTVEVVVVKTIEGEAAPGADNAEAKMPLQARIVLSFIFQYCLSQVSQRGKLIVCGEGNAYQSLMKQ